MTNTATTIYPAKAEHQSLADYTTELIRICDDAPCDEQLLHHAQLILSFTKALADEIPFFRSLVINYETSDYASETSLATHLTRNAIGPYPEATGNNAFDLMANAQQSAELYRRGIEACKNIPLVFKHWIAANAIELASAQHPSCAFENGSGVIEVKRAEAGNLNSPFVLTIEHSEKEIHDYPIRTIA